MFEMSFHTNSHHNSKNRYMMLDNMLVPELELELVWVPELVLEQRKLELV
jgi:hypothetical protein